MVNSHHDFELLNRLSPRANPDSFALEASVLGLAVCFLLRVYRLKGIMICLRWSSPIDVTHAHGMGFAFKAKSKSRNDASNGKAAVHHGKTSIGFSSSGFNNNQRKPPETRLWYSFDLKSGQTQRSTWFVGRRKTPPIVDKPASTSFIDVRILYWAVCLNPAIRWFDFSFLC